MTLDVGNRCFLQSVIAQAVRQTRASNKSFSIGCALCVHSAPRDSRIQSHSTSVVQYKQIGGHPLSNQKECDGGWRVNFDFAKEANATPVTYLDPDWPRVLYSYSVQFPMMKGRVLLIYIAHLDKGAQVLKFLLSVRVSQTIDCQIHLVESILVGRRAESNQLRGLVGLRPTKSILPYSGYISRV